MSGMPLLCQQVVSAQFMQPHVANSDKTSMAFADKTGKAVRVQSVYCMSRVISHTLDIDMNWPSRMAESIAANMCMPVMSLAHC